MGRHPLRCLVLVLLVAGLSACHDDAEVESLAWEIELPGAPPEAMTAGVPWADPEPTLYERLEELREVAESPRHRGLLLRIGALSGAYARMRELSAALARIRDADKPVHCHFASTDNAGFGLLAAGCDRISMSPSGLLNLVGVSARAIYAREILDRIGVSAELQAAGRFKSGGDVLTRSDMPDHMRETLNHIVRVLQEHLVGAVTRRRALSGAAVKQAIGEGPLTADAARRHGLVDDVGYADEAREHLRRAAGVPRVTRKREERKRGFDLSSLLAEVTQGPAVPPGERHVVLVPIVGTIGIGGLGPRPPGSTDTETFVDEMRRIADDKDVAALVLRIDSPGGSALASDLMWHAVRQVGKKKPVFASIGDMAASGGYYIASAASDIYAEPTSLLGSIGVVGGKIAFEALADKVGIHVEQIRGAPRAGWESPAMRFTESERAAIADMVQTMYDLFLRRVSIGRDMPVPKVVPLAEGRLLDARAALKGGLIDKLGGLTDTLSAARKAAKLPKGSQVVLWPERRSFLETLLGAEAEARSAAAAGALPAFYREFARMDDIPLLGVLAAGEVVAAMPPFGLRIR